MSRLFVVPALQQLGEVRLLCKALRRRGHAVLVMASVDQAACYSDCADAVAVCADFLSTDAVLTALGTHTDELARFVTVDGRAWPAMVEAALALNIPFPGLQGYVNSRLKPRMRELLDGTLPLRTDLLSARDCTPARVAAAVDRVGIPFVSKPIWGQGSDYVEIVESETEAFESIVRTLAELPKDGAYRPFTHDGIAWDPCTQLLIEEFAPGREFSVEGFVQRGDFVPLLIQEKFRWGREGRLRFETANLCPTPFLSSDEQTYLCGALGSALSVLGVDDTFVHAECKWDGRRFSVIEINSRLGGGSVPAMLDFWFGMDVRETAVDLSLGHPVQRDYEGRDGFLLGVFVNAHRPGVVRGLRGLDWARSRPEYCFETRYLRPGQSVPSRVGSCRGRDGWMYCYDVFYWCHGMGQVEDLYGQTLDRVRLEFTDRPDV